MHVTPDCALGMVLEETDRFSLIEDSFIRVIYLLRANIELQEGRMEKDRLVSISKVTCNHEKQRQYTQTRFDILNGFTLVLTRCLNCHKILAFEVKKLD